MLRDVQYTVVKEGDTPRGGKGGKACKGGGGTSSVSTRFFTSEELQTMETRMKWRVCSRVCVFF